MSFFGEGVAKQSDGCSKAQPLLESRTEGTSRSSHADNPPSTSDEAMK